MTVFELNGINRLNYKKWIHNWSESESFDLALANAALCKAYDIHCGHSEEGARYCKKTQCSWPLDSRLFNCKYSGKYYKAKYGTFENYKNSEDYVVSYEQDDDCGMCQLYSLLDNFRSYYGIFRYADYLIVLSVGSSLTSKSYNYDLEKLSEGFAVVINVALNVFSLFALGEDDGNYWVEKEIPYNNLSIYDRGVVCSMINDIDESRFFNKARLIEKILYKK